MDAGGGDAGQAKVDVDGGGAVADIAINQVAAVVYRKSRFSVFYKTAGFISNFFGKHFVAITNLVIVVITYGGEELLEKYAFRCPCDHSLTHGYTLSYVFGIFFFLWIGGICAYSATWKVCHGCLWCQKCCSCADCCKSCCTPFSRYYYALSMSVFLKTSVVPVSWLFFVLQDGDYFACWKSKSSCDVDGKIIETDEYRSWKSYSGVFAYAFLAIYMLFALISRALYRCCVSKSFLLHKYISVYKEIEEDELIKQMPEAAKKLAPAVVQAFLNKEDLREEDWETASKFVVIHENDKKAYYSPLHNYVVKKNMLRKTNPRTIHPLPGTVEEQAATNQNVPPPNGDTATNNQ